METAIRNIHLLSVILFLLIYIIKTYLLLFNKEEALAMFAKGFKIPEMIISFLFLATGIYLITQIPEIKSLLIFKIIAVFISIPLAIFGFKKKNKILAASSLLLIIAAYGFAEMSKKQKSKALENITTSVLSGKELYEASCSPCHGDDGKLQKLGATDLSLTTMDIFSKIEIVKKGKGAMTPFEDQLTEDQIKSVVEYTESLKK